MPLSRAPKALEAHKASHSTGGTDALVASDIGAAELNHDHSAGVGNVRVGPSASPSVSGSQNVAIGANAMYSTAGGSNNIGIGAYAGYGLQTGSENVLIGAGAAIDDIGRNRCVALGYGATTPAVDGALSIGGGGVNAMGGLTTNTDGGGATSYLRVWLNGAEYRIAIRAA